MSASWLWMLRSLFRRGVKVTVKRAAQLEAYKVENELQRDLAYPLKTQVS